MDAFSPDESGGLSYIKREFTIFFFVAVWLKAGLVGETYTTKRQRVWTGRVDTLFFIPLGALLLYYFSVRLKFSSLRIRELV
jgi:hypothetical protein